MNALKMLVAVTVVCLVGASARADNAKLIVGTWELTKVDEGGLPKGSIVEFTKDGKVKVTGKKEDKEVTIEGTYKVDGESLIVTTKVGEEERKQTITIVKLTETELHTKNMEGKMAELTKKK